MNAKNIEKMIELHKQYKKISVPAWNREPDTYQEYHTKFVEAVEAADVTNNPIAAEIKALLVDAIAEAQTEFSKIRMPMVNRDPEMGDLMTNLNDYLFELRRYKDDDQIKHLYRALNIYDEGGMWKRLKLLADK